MRIYVASRAYHAEMWKELRDAGHPIHCSWIDKLPRPEDRPSLIDDCLLEARESDRLVLYIPKTRDLPLKLAWGEMFIALAHGVPVILVAPPEITDQMLAYIPLHSGVTRASLLDALNPSWSPTQSGGGV